MIRCAARSECVDEVFDRDASLLEDARERAGFQLTVIGYDAACRATAHHDVAAALRATAKPRRSRARTACAPDTRGSLGMLCDVERRDDRLADVGERKLLEIELGSFAKVGDRLFDRLALRGRARFRI